MNILSYRGPSSAGGVSGALSRLLEQTDMQQWWYLQGQNLSNRSGLQSQPHRVADIPSRVVEGHYRYCNNFLWPILHDLPEFATFSADDKLHYKQFNRTFASNVFKSEHLGKSSAVHINDYQLALAAEYLESVSGARDTDIFWHIPWPKFVSPENARPLEEIAKGLLSSRQIGFHVTEYATNFLKFVETNLSGYRADFHNRMVTSGHDKRRLTEIVVLPLGVDFDHWTKQSQTPEQIFDVKQIVPGEFVLSVDRMDYTKGVLQRIEAIDQFFSDDQTWINEISFLQVCQRSRQNLPAFDDYWHKCRARAQEVNARWRQGNWQPIVWIDEPLSPAVLAQLYRQANAMLITPLRDGLNLTAKEFVCCSDSGVLILSRSAGVWHELGEYAVPIDPLSIKETSDQIKVALAMSTNERLHRLIGMKRTLKQNTLGTWWHRLTKNVAAERVVELSDYSQRHFDQALPLAR